MANSEQAVNGRAAAVQTSGAAAPELADGQVTTVQIATVDALTGGQTLRSLARSTSDRVFIPASMRPLLDRLGTQLAMAAAAELSQIERRPARAVTGDTITDEQIRAIRDSAARVADGDPAFVIRLCDRALGVLTRPGLTEVERAGIRARARARCADILNGRGGRP